jgi:FKBP-type peptidyl-prolyl cis-trans isomerase FklB
VVNKQLFSMRLLGFAFCFLLLSCQQEKNINAQSEITDMNEKEQVAYNMGILLANDLKSMGIEDIRAEVVLQAINDFKNGKSTISAQDANKAVEDYQTTMAKKAGEDFLAENAKNPDVVVLPSGLQYTIISSGDSDVKPGPTSKVTTHYHGTLIDGTVFDSSVDRGEPISFPVNGVIKGWTEALQLMSVGDKWKLFIPQDLAYGARGAGGVIKPYSALIFEVELLNVQN